MMKVSCFVFLTFTLVLSYQDVSKRGGLGSKRGLQKVTRKSTNQALTNLMTAGKPIIFSGPQIVSGYCSYDMEQLWESKHEGSFCNYKKKGTTCYATGTLANEVMVYSKKEDEPPNGSNYNECANWPEFQAIFLRYIENGDSFTFLDPSVAPWFFTSTLGGCDMFVATETNHGDTPLVIHSNRNTIDNAVGNLEAKEKFVDQLLTKLRTYRVIARVHWTSNDEKVKKEIDDHLQKYVGKHPGVRLIPYIKETSSSFQGYQFIGHCRDSRWFKLWGQPRWQWRFINKRINDGAKSEFIVSQEGNII